MNERERIEQLIETLNISARQFAEQIHVKPATISNMMVGRNNPSLDVMKRIMQRFPTLNPEWLVLGKGEMWRSVPGEDPKLFDLLPPDDAAKQRPKTKKTEEQQTIAVPPKKISKIVVYYTDNTFEEFKSSVI